MKKLPHKSQNNLCWQQSIPSLETELNGLLQLMLIIAICALTGLQNVQARSYTFRPLGFQNTACSGWERVTDPDKQQVTFKGDVDDSESVIGKFWYQYNSRWSRLGELEGPTYRRILKNPKVGYYQLCWTHTTRGNKQTTGTLSTAVPVGADLTALKALADFAPGEGLLTYDITVINNGPGKAMDVTVEDFLPFGVQLDSIGSYDENLQAFSVEQPRVTFQANDTQVTCKLSDAEGYPIVTCQLGEMDVNQEVIIMLTVQFMPEAWDENDIIRNKVAVTASNGIAPFEDDSDSVETPYSFGGEPIANTPCSINLCKLSTPAPRSAKSPDIQVTFFDGTGRRPPNILTHFVFTNNYSDGARGPRVGAIGRDDKKTRYVKPRVKKVIIGNVAIGRPLATTGGLLGAWDTVVVSIDKSTPLAQCPVGSITNIKMKIGEIFPC